MGADTATKNQLERPGARLLVGIVAAFNAYALQDSQEAK